MNSTTRRQIFDERLNMLPEEHAAKLRELRDILLAIAGQDMVIMPNGERDIDNILANGEILQKTYKEVAGEPGDCHNNAVKQWFRNPTKYSVAGGYALSEDGLWRQHSWLVDDMHRTYETTAPRLLYYGWIHRDKEFAKMIEALPCDRREKLLQDWLESSDKPWNPVVSDHLSYPELEKMSF